jgi:hypothetical protein
MSGPPIPTGQIWLVTFKTHEDKWSRFYEIFTDRSTADHACYQGNATLKQYGVDPVLQTMTLEEFLRAL